jgi:hypothetical protein
MNTSDTHALLRAIRRPVMLIAIGGLFALDHADSYSFSRTWPVLIIIFGVMKLLERAAAHPGGTPS